MANQHSQCPESPLVLVPAQAAAAQEGANADFSKPYSRRATLRVGSMSNSMPRSLLVLCCCRVGFLLRNPGG